MKNVAGSWRLPVFAALATISAIICLGSTFLRGIWFFPAVFAVLAAGIGSELARRGGVGRPWVPLGGAAALLFYLLLRYGNDQAIAHLIPTPGSLDRLQELAAAGRADIARYAAPIGVSPGVEFLTVAGVGLVALAVDTLAVTWRRAALAGLPLLVLFTVPTAFAPDGVGWLAFTIAAVGFLALLLAEARERVSRWGRAVTSVKAKRNWTPDIETSPLSQVGRRVGATALGVALLVPAALPNVPGVGGFGWGSGGFGVGDGDNKVTVVNPILSLGRDLRRPDNRAVLRYTGEPAYIRLVGLDEFTGPRWKPSELEVSRDDNDVEDGIATPPGLASNVTTKPVRYRFEIFGFDQAWLPLPYPASRVTDIAGTWLYDRDTFNVFGENTSTLELTYGVMVREVRPTVEQLRAAGRPPTSLRRYLRLPSDLPRVVEATARAEVGAATSDYDRALALQEWLRSEQFTYSTEVSDTIGDSTGSEAVAAFLASRAGYCVHFASAMAVMARTLGIPARVAVGFTPGVQDQSDNSYIVGLHDLHAWPELYFSGVGWTRFEPTPGIRTGEPPAWAQPANAANPGAPLPGEGGAEAGGGNGEAPRSARAADARLDAIDAAQNQRAGGGGAALDTGLVRILLVPLLVGLSMLLLAVPAVVRRLVRRRRWSGVAGAAAQARAAWDDLQDTLTDFGHRWVDSDSPRAGVDRLVADRGLTGDPAAAARRLATATERARYAASMPALSEIGDLRADADAVRSGLSAKAGRRSRWAARVLPRSTAAVVHAVGERMADLLDAVDAGIAALTGRLSGRRAL